MEKHRPLYCAFCGVMIVENHCRCPGGASIWALPMSVEWEQYFIMDGSVKAILIKLSEMRKNENRKIHNKI